MPLSADQVGAFTNLMKTLVNKLTVTYAASNDQAVISSGCGVGCDDGSMVMEPTSNITVDLSASGADGLDTGSPANNTWYYLYLIYNPTTATYAGLFSLSQSSPTMPSGYTKKRLISAARTDGSAQFPDDVVQQDARLTYRNYRIILSGGVSTSLTTVGFSTYAPPTVTKTANILVRTDSTYGVTGNISGCSVYTDSGGTHLALSAKCRNTGTWAYSETSCEDVVLEVDQTVYYRITLANGRVSLYIRSIVLDI